MSSQSSGSTIRLIILFLVLGLVGFAYYNDTVNRKPQVEKLTEEFFALEESEDGPLSPVKFQEKIKMKPDRTFKAGKYDVEEYKLRRTIPFLSFGSMFVVYENQQLFKVAQGAEPTVESIEKATGIGSAVQKPKELDVAIAGMGLPTPDFNKKEDGKEEAKQTEKEEPKEAPKDQAQEEKKDEKQDEAPAPEKKEGDGQNEAQGEKKDGDQPKEGDGG